MKENLNSSRKPKAVAVMSGGVDSATCAAIAISQGFEIAGLHLNYGQMTAKKELECFNRLAEFYNIKEKLVIDFTGLSKIGGSSLTDANIEIPKADLSRKDIANTYVPFRNGLLLSIATAWAEVIKAEAIFIGPMAYDYIGYPDCRQEFYDAFQEAIIKGTRPETKIKIHTPLIHMKKEDVIKIGHKLGVPFELTWSCYKSDDLACGECDSCAYRQRAFHRAGLVDPIPYAKTMTFDE